ncbi:resolvase-like protein [Cytobacillus firmus]|uniref:Resolvase-like protein n=2 Tax=Cytobacillus TaxID=2675230 RepID=A0A366JJ37_CYTFI|nr:resolvase-like protein [Cytobacillus firmus]TDX39313.1 resolvase-like protein [Cytobacillus oceanisediminis]
MVIFGYARVSTEEQNLDLQLDALQKFGVEKIYKEKLTGTRRDRPQLEELLKVLRSIDKVVVYKLDRISRSTKHLIELSEVFNEMDVHFVPLLIILIHQRQWGSFSFVPWQVLRNWNEILLVNGQNRGCKQQDPEGKRAVDLPRKKIR